MKRGFDILASGTALLLLLPLLLGVAVLVKLSSPGPAIFRQLRVGRGFRQFNILKFRTMVVNAPAKGLAITADGDPRITRIGGILRKYKLDELPQLFNVLRGDMSLVGPRPEVPKYVELFRDDYAELLKVRPGITGCGSLEFVNESAYLAASADPEKTYIEDVLPKKIALCRDYLQNASLGHDILLILKTILALVRPAAINHENR